MDSTRTKFVQFFSIETVKKNLINKIILVVANEKEPKK